MVSGSPAVVHYEGGRVMSAKTLVLIILVTALSLTGSKCFFVASSGGGSSDRSQDEESGLLVIIGDGQFVDGPVAGLRYISGSVAGITGANGEFQFEVGAPVRFYIGDIHLGTASRGKSIITPLDLVADGSVDTPAVLNIARLLQSLDAVPGDDAITLPEQLRTVAVVSNEGVSASIEFLDFADETAFVNAASQLVAVLTAGYPFAAVLVDADSARTHLVEALARHGISQ